MDDAIIWSNPFISVCLEPQPIVSCIESYEGFKECCEFFPLLRRCQPGEWRRLLENIVLSLAVPIYCYYLNSIGKEMMTGQDVSRIAWIGTGIMGLPMCGHLMEAGYKTVVHSRTKAKSEPLLARGAEWAVSPKAAAEHADVIFTIVGFPRDVREVYFGKEGVMAGVAPGSVVVDMTTTEPSLAVEIYGAAKRMGVDAVDAPVSGGDVGARNATLSIMVGGDEDAVQRVIPLLRVMGKNIVHQGPAGAGQHAKMCNQIVIAGTMIGVAESLIYGYKAGLDLPTMLQSISGGAAACWSLDNYVPRMLKRDFAPGFMVDHFIKDLRIALEESKKMGLQLPGLELAERLYTKLQELGHGREGTHALLVALEEMSGVKIAPRE
jgi:3-hydroxyisobutyrate dehydrogenase